MPYINVDEAYILDNTGLQVDMATDIPFADAGFTDAQKAQARKNIAAGGSNPNLLDNAYFVGGGSQLGDGVFPINQRGLTSYSAYVNSIDRWYAAAAMTVAADGILCDAIVQKIPTDGALRGKTLTFSVLKADGTIISGTAVFQPTGDTYFYNSGGDTLVYNSYFSGFEIVSSSKIAAVKLELGTVSTLPNDAPPDFGEELAKCKRRLRYVPLKRTPVILDGGYSVAVVTLTGIEMASSPTASLITVGTAYAYNPLTSATPTSASVIAFDYNTPTIQLGLNAALNGIGVVYDTVIQLSCEL